MDDNGRRQIVCNGYHNEWKIVTGAGQGQVEVRVPRVDDRILKQHNEPRFKSSFILPYLRRTKNIEELLPVFYLKGVSTGDFQEAFEKILGKEVIGLSAQIIVRLNDIKDIKIFFDSSHEKSIRLFYCIMCKRREELFQYLKQNHVLCELSRAPLYKHFIKERNNSLPISEKYHKFALSLPMFSFMREDEILYVINHIRHFFGLF